MPDFFQTPRFELPEDWTPEGTACVKVTIPNDPAYFAQLIGWLDAFKFSRNFAPDSTRTGAATVSRTWQAALESQPITIQGCEMVELRINPETCLLEVNCSTDPENPDWQPVVTSEYDPRTDIKTPVLYPDPPPEGQSNQCLAAANIAGYVWWAGEKYADLLGGDNLFFELVNLITSIISMLFVLATEIIVDETLQVATYVDEEEIIADWALLDQQDFIDLLVCMYDENGVFMPGMYGDLLTELSERATVNQAWYIVRYIVILMGVGGLTVAGKIGGIDEAECGSCDNTLEWHFEGDDPAYTILEGELVYDGTSESNVIAEECFDVSGYTQWRYKLNLSLIEGTIAGIEWSAFLHNPASDLCQYTYEVYDSGDTLITSDTILTTVSEDVWTPRIWTVTPFAVPSGAYMLVYASFGIYGSYPCGDGKNRIDDIIITYEG